MQQLKVFEIPVIECNVIENSDGSKTIFPIANQTIQTAILSWTETAAQPLFHVACPKPSCEVSTVEQPYQKRSPGRPKRSREEMKAETLVEDKVLRRKRLNTLASAEYRDRKQQKVKEQNLKMLE